MKNVFNTTDVNEIANRINTLTPSTAAQWGSMNVAQMLAHCNVTYEMVYDNIHQAPNAFTKFMLKLFVKKMVVNTIPYKKNNRTAPQFLITSPKQFEIEKQRLITYIQQTQQLGATHFDGKASHSFGNLTANEWNNMFYKHLDHHLTQFGA